MRDEDDIQVLCECPVCKRKVVLNSSVVKFGEFMLSEKCEMDGQYTLTYFDCPQCTTRVFVQADDTTTKQRLNHLVLQLGKVAALKRQGKKPTKKQRRNVEADRELLKGRRKVLQDALTGKRLTDAYGTEQEVRFIEL